MKTACRLKPGERIPCLKQKNIILQGSTSMPLPGKAVLLGVP